MALPSFKNSPRRGYDERGEGVGKQRIIENIYCLSTSTATAAAAASECCFYAM